MTAAPLSEAEFPALINHTGVVDGLLIEAGESSPGQGAPQVAPTRVSSSLPEGAGRERLP